MTGAMTTPRAFRFRSIWRYIRNNELRFSGAAPPKGSRNHEEPLRYALIGAGSAARTHLADLLSKPNLIFVGIADPAPRRLWRISKDYYSVPHFSDARSLLLAARPEIVSICAPPKFHKELVVMALSSGAHVICEKPMAMSIEEAEQMEKVRISKRRLGLINFSYRNLSSFRFARRQILAGALGKITRVSAVYLQSFMRSTSTLWSWRNDISIAGYGALGDLGVHMIDGVRFITGLEFQRVVGVAGTVLGEKSDMSGVVRKITTDTNAMFLAELDGRTFALFETAQVVPGYGDFFRIEVSGELGTICVDSEHPDEIRRSTTASVGQQSIWKTEMPLENLPPEFETRGQPFTPGVLIDAIRGTAVEYPTFSDGIEAQRVLSALKHSMKSDTWVTVTRRSSSG